MSALIFLAVAALLFCGGCSRTRPVAVRDAPADKIMVVEESTRQEDGRAADDIVSVTVRDGGNWRTERFFVRGQALVYVFNTQAAAGNPHRAAPQGEFSTEATLRTIREFVTASRSHWFVYRGRTGHGRPPAGPGTNVRDDGAFDYYEGRSPEAGKAAAKGMRMYVNRTNGLLEYQDCDRGSGVAVKAIAYFGHRPLPGGLFDPGDVRVRSFEFLDRKIVLRYENLQIYQETMLPKGAAAGK